MENKENLNNTKMASRKRKLTYRNLQNELEDIGNSGDVSLIAIKKLDKVLKNVRSLFEECDTEERVQNVDEIILDVNVLSNTTKLFKKCAQALNFETTVYNPLEFATKIKENVTTQGGNFQTTDLLSLLERSRNIIPDAQLSFSSLHGTFDVTKLPEKKTPVKRSRIEKETVEKRAPEEIVNDNSLALEDYYLKLIFKLLCKAYKQNNNEPLDYYGFVIDTSDFSATVNNMFYCSFLVKDGLMSLNRDDDGNIKIRPVSKEELNSFKRSGLENKQCMISIDMSEWKTFKNAGYIQKNKK